jgi:hypothetical protein
VAQPWNAEVTTIVGAPLLRFLQGRVRCCLYDEIFDGDQNGAASCIVPTLRKEREEWGTHFVVSACKRLGHATPGKTTRCEKGLRENHKRTSPRRESRTTSRRAGLSALKMSTGFCSPGNARP